jgi:hypothetical protein
MMFGDAEKQIRVRDCEPRNLWLALALWCRDVILVIKGMEAYATNDAVQTLFATSVYDLIQGKGVPFRTKRDYLALARHAYFTSWKETSPSSKKIEEIRRKVILTKHDEVTPIDLDNAMKANVAYCIASLREAFGTFLIGRPMPPKPVTISSDVRAIATQILAGESNDHGVLADAAEDSGYEYYPALDHLRAGPHGSGPCWGVLSVLGLHPFQKGA